jgi:hypothetical protein
VRARRDATARAVLCGIDMLNNNSFKKVLSTLGLLCLASLANAPQVLAAPRPRTAAVSPRTADLNIQIPKRDGSITGVRGADKAAGWDSQPYHVRGDVAYEVRGNSVALKQVHVLGWSETNGHYPYFCGHFGVNAKHLWIDGRDVSAKLELQSSVSPQGWVTSSWVSRLLGPTYPNIARGKTVTIRAYAGYDGGSCIQGGNLSITSSVVIK